MFAVCVKLLAGYEGGAGCTKSSAERKVYSMYEVMSRLDGFAGCVR